MPSRRRTERYVPRHTAARARRFFVSDFRRRDSRSRTRGDALGQSGPLGVGAAGGLGGRAVLRADQPARFARAGGAAARYRRGAAGARVRRGAERRARGVAEAQPVPQRGVAGRIYRRDRSRMNQAMPGRHVLITGASRGIGEGLPAHSLPPAPRVAAGDRVIGCGRSPSAIAHERYRHVVVDVTDPEAVEGLLREVKQSLKTLDVLINNAGVAGMNAIALTPLSAARRMVETNFLAPFNLTREALRLMRRSAAARIVNISTVAVPLRLEGEAVYAASKSALETFTRIAARELAPFGITCNAVGPCPIKTRLTAGVPDAKIQALIDRQAIRRWGVPEDVVNVVDFFLRPESGMVTGQVVYLGGAG